MPLVTLADLIASGAHRTLEQIASRPDFDVSLAADYLSRRYGSNLQPAPGVVSVLTGRVQDAVRAGSLTNRIESPIEAEVPQMPGMDAGYTYTVIGKLKDPLRSDDKERFLTFPMKFNSPTLMSFEQLQRATDQLLNQMLQTGNPRFEGELMSPGKYQNAITHVVRDSTGDEALPTIDVLSVYRGV